MTFPQRFLLILSQTDRCPNSLLEQQEKLASRPKASDRWFSLIISMHSRKPFHIRRCFPADEKSSENWSNLGGFCKILRRVAVVQLEEWWRAVWWALFEHDCWSANAIPGRPLPEQEVFNSAADDCYFPPLVHDVWTIFVHVLTITGQNSLIH